jgi:hypothetical protein
MSCALSPEHARAFGEGEEQGHGRFPQAPHERPTIYVRFSNDGRFIRKWGFKPFDGGVRYVPAHEPFWENPDGPQAA